MPTRNNRHHEAADAVGIPGIIFGLAIPVGTKLQGKLALSSSCETFECDKQHDGRAREAAPLHVWSPQANCREVIVQYV